MTRAGPTNPTGWEAGEGTRGPRASWPVHTPAVRKPNLWTSPARDARGRPPFQFPRHHTPTTQLTSGDVRRSPLGRSKPLQPVRPTIPDEKSPLTPYKKWPSASTPSRLAFPFLFPDPAANPPTPTVIAYLPNRRCVSLELCPCQRRQRPTCLLTWNATWSL